jgi:hypothetical protein
MRAAWPNARNALLKTGGKDCAPFSPDGALPVLEHYRKRLIHHGESERESFRPADQGDVRNEAVQPVCVKEKANG